MNAVPATDTSCPIGRATQLLGDRWILLILRNATVGVTRFDQFQEQLGIADNILSNRLARLVEHGLLTKVPYRGERRTRYEYRLTTAGADIVPVLHALAAWGQEHTTPPRHAKPMRVIHVVCGNDIPVGQFCPHCERPVARDEIQWVRPWHGDTPQTLAKPVPVEKEGTP